MKLLRMIAIVGNILFILFIVHNAIDERGQGIGIVQAVALKCLIALLVLDIILLIKKHDQPKQI